MHFYYLFKPLLPRSLQIWLRRRLIHLQRARYEENWPIDEAAGRTPEGWTGWPDGKQFALLLSHDVEMAYGQGKCRDLAQLEIDRGVRSCFGFVPERYQVSEDLRNHLVSRGFEIHVHGLLHDGKLLRSRKVFDERAKRINHYIKAWNCVGFRAPSMHHNLEWFHDLDIEYDSSTFDTDPYQPQPDGVKTIFPFWVPHPSGQGGYVELPYTMDQDFTLFVLLQHTDIEQWKRKLAWVVEHGGMVLVNTHPDYMHMKTDRTGLEAYPVRLYTELLDHIQKEYGGSYWHALPREVAAHVKTMAG